MAAQVESVIAYASSSLGTPFEQTVTTTNLGGQTPVAVKVELAFTNNTTGALNDSEHGSIGISDGTRTACVAWRAQDVNSGNTNTDSYGSTTRLGGVLHASSDNTLHNYFTLKEFTTNGCVITWDQAPVRDFVLRFTFYVCKYAEVKVQTLLTTGTIGTSSETFTLLNSSLHPALGFLMTSRASISSGDNYAALARIGTGYFVSDQAGTPTIKQCAYGWAREDGTSNPFQGSVFYNSENTTARCLASATVPVANGSGSNELRCSNTAAGSFAVVRENAIDTTARQVAALVLDFGGEVQTNLGFSSITTVAGSPTSTTVTCGWRPQFYNWHATNVAGNGYVRGNLSAHVSSPAGISRLNTTGGSLGWKSDNRQSDATDTYSIHNSTGICYIYGDDDTLSVALSHSAFTSTGFTVAHDTFPSDSTKVNSWIAIQEVITFDPDTLTDTSTLSTATGLATSLLDPDILTDTSTLSTATGLATSLLDPDILTDTSTLSTATGLATTAFDPDQLTDTSTLSTATGLATSLLDPDILTDASTLSTATGLATTGFDPDILTDTSTLSTATGSRAVLLDPDILTDTNSLSTATGQKSGLVTFDPDTLTESSSLSTATGSRAVLLDPDQLTDTSTLSTATGLTSTLFDPDILTDTSTLSTATGQAATGFDPDTLTDTSTLSTATGFREALLDPDQLTDTSSLSTATGQKSGLVTFDPDTLTDNNSLSTAAGYREVLFDPDTLADTNTLSTATGGSFVLFDPDTLTDANSLSPAGHARGINLSCTLTGTGSLVVVELTATISLQVSFAGTGNLTADLTRSMGLAVVFHGSGSLSPDITGSALAPVSQFERVQHSLLTAAQAGPYYVTQYDADTNLVTVGDTQVPPASIIATEISARFGVPVRYRLNHRLEKQQWPWEIVIDFHQPVALEFFEEALAANPIYLPRDKTNGLQQVTLELESVDYEHPLQHQPERGTRARVKVLARLGPV